MLDPIKISATIDTPAITLDKSTGEMIFSGRSLPEDVTKIYSPVQAWFKEYCQNPNPETEIEFNLDYYNSSTSRIIVKLLIETEKIHNKTSQVHVMWFYRANDEVMRNRGLELKSVINLPFDMVEK